ncbi:hypothetical protein VFPPC_15407 [Pochonia chlamydosporia 170]|uniref:Uncharacterized protein n=1 Tax=Pochonia chlamydosporia 170 TaxID=1380566 RepID=A0A179G9H6_METCM|nr:hypothetical protein VFPPC_15407 [Pochonia chlamydosporia 170]OAQ74071.1 hypothetical protein VFPPC_15407 [Pochonia chlamydosporia 170]
MAGFAHHKTWTDLMPNLNFITTNRQCRSSGSEPSSQSPSRRFGLFLHAQTRTFCLSSPQLVSLGAERHGPYRAIVAAFLANPLVRSFINAAWDQMRQDETRPRPQ